MSQEWQGREAEGDRRGEWSGDLQRKAEEDGSVTTHGLGREGEPGSTSGTAGARAGNFFAFRLDSIAWR